MHTKVGESILSYNGPFIIGHLKLPIQIALPHFQNFIGYLMSLTSSFTGLVYKWQKRTMFFLIPWDSVACGGNIKACSVPSEVSINSSQGWLCFEITVPRIFTCQPHL